MSSLHSPWQAYVPRICRAHRHWLTDTGSLTQKLKAHSHHFAVERRAQYHAPIALAESPAIDMPMTRQVWQRDVVLLCNGTPVVYAHTVTPLETVARDWPFFKRLGNKALGVALFANPLIHRATFEFTRLCARDALYQTAQKNLQSHGITLPRHIWARRCVFHHTRQANSRMMVTEIMLPAIYELKRTAK